MACLVLVFSVIKSSYAAQDCKSYIPEETPDNRYTIDATNGTVLDKQTGLMWSRCALGQTGSDCAGGSIAFFTWQDALSAAGASNLAGHANWRLPNIEELRSIVAYHCASPSINLNAFPNTLASLAWSSSPTGFDSNNTWGIGFTGGYGTSASRISTGVYVRLVR